MENKKIWQALIRQMVIELVFLTLFYLYVGNNFGNNFVEWVLRKKGGLALLQRLINRWFSTSSHWFILLIKGLLGICLSVPFSILFGLFVFSSFWIPLAITALICLDRTRKSVLNEFLGEPSDVAIPKIQECYNSKQKIYITFVVISRILFFILLLLKAINAPEYYVADFVIDDNLKWKMTNGLMAKLIVIVGAVLLFASALIRIMYFIEIKTHFFKKHICPKCHRMGVKCLINIKKIQDAEYTYTETDSGYYSSEKIGEVRDSAGNTIGDVYGDTWHDTSRVRSHKICDAIWDYTYEWRPCYCTEHKEVKKNH